METYDYDMDIVAMSKQELAQMYAPDLTPRQVHLIVDYLGEP